MTHALIARSEYATLHTSRSPAMRSALSALPGYDSAKAGYDSAQAAITATLAAAPPAVADEQLLAEVVDALSAGRELPDLGSRALEAEQAGQRLAAERRVLGMAAERIKQDLDGTLQGDIRAVFRDLQRQLAQVLDDVRPLVEVFGAGEVDRISAIDRDLDVEWKNFRRLLGVYSDIRDAQRKLALHSRRAELVQYKLDPHDLFSNVVDVFPHWREWAKHGFLVEPTTGRRVPISAPWPEDYASWAFLAWLSTSQAKPWVPTVEEAEANREEAQRPPVEPRQADRTEERPPPEKPPVAADSPKLVRAAR